MSRTVTRSLTAIALFTMTSMLSAMPAAAHTEAFYTPHICQATNDFGEPTSQILFQGWAVNNHASNTYILKCPVPFVRNTSNLSAVRVRLRAVDRNSQRSVLLRICETRYSDGAVTCPIAAQDQSGVAFDGGLDVLEAAFNPSAATRWLFLDIHIPDRTALGASAVIGYRVCRGSC